MNEPTKETERRLRRATVKRAEWDAEWKDAIRQASDAGMPQARIGELAGVSQQRIAKLLKALAVVALVLFAWPLASAQATPQVTGTAANDPYLLKWLADDAMPPPRGPLELDIVAQSDTADGAGADAALYPDGHVQIEMSNAVGINSPATFYHELGHAFDDQNLTDLARIRFRAILHLTAPWGSPGAGEQPNAPRECFADTYRLLAEHPWAATRRGFRRIQRYQGLDGYGPRGFPRRRIGLGHNCYTTYYQVRKAAVLIRSMG